MTGETAATPGVAVINLAAGLVTISNTTLQFNEADGGGGGQGFLNTSLIPKHGETAAWDGPVAMAAAPAVRVERGSAAGFTRPAARPP